LEPTDGPPDLLPVDGMPVGRTPGSRTSGHFCRRHLCLSPESVGRGSLVTEHPREVSPLSRRGDVVRGRTHPLSGRLPAGVRFLPHPFPAASSAPFAVGLPSRGGDGVTSFISSITPGEGRFVHLVDHSGGGSCLSAGGASSATGDNAAPVPGHV